MLCFQSQYFQLKTVGFSFFKRACVFQKLFFKVKVLKTFKISSDCHMKTCRSYKRRAIFKIPSTAFQKSICSFYWIQNKPLRKKMFSCVKAKINSNFAVNLAEMLKKPTIRFCEFAESHFTNICTLHHVTMECIEISWLCKHRKKV